MNAKEANKVTGSDEPAEYKIRPFNIHHCDSFIIGMRPRRLTFWEKICDFLFWPIAITFVLVGMPVIAVLLINYVTIPILNFII